MSKQPETQEVKKADVEPELRAALKEAMKQLRFQQEPKREFQLISKYLQKAYQTDQVASDPVFAKFLYEEIGPGLMKRLSQEYSYDNEYLEIVADLLFDMIAMLTLEVKANRFDPTFIESMLYVFLPESKIHTSSNCYKITEQELRKMRMQAEKWRSEIKVGDSIDVLRKESNQCQVQGWCQGIVAEIDDDSSDIGVQFPHLLPSDDFYIDRWSTNIAKPGSKTREAYKWKDETFGLVDGKVLEIDANDNANWHKSTVLERKIHVMQGRKIELVRVGFRIYRDKENCIKRDEHGTYEGFSSKQDTWIPFYSPRIQPFLSKTGKMKRWQDEEMDQDIDDAVQPEQGQSRVYAVPRIFKCTSKKFMGYMNFFGNEGCFDKILDILENAKFEDEKNEIVSFKSYLRLAMMICLPSVSYHKAFVAEFGERIVNSIKTQLSNVSDKNIKEINKHLAENLFQSLGKVQKRIMTVADADKELEVFKLLISKIFMNSKLLEPRINGIRELNQIILNNQSWRNTSAVSQDFILQWLTENQIFNLVWDARKTHQQVVERTDEIFKLLLQKDMMTEELFDKFWSLASEYKREVYKIIKENTYYLKEPHRQAILEKLIGVPVEKIDSADFDLLGEVERMADSAFKNKLTKFFWRVISEGNSCDEELLEKGIMKLTQMLKYTQLDLKKPLFLRLTGQMGKTEFTALPVLALFEQLIRDEDDKATGYYQQSSNQSTGRAKRFRQRTIGDYKWCDLRVELKENTELDVKKLCQGLTPKERAELMILLRAYIQDEAETITRRRIMELNGYQNPAQEANPMPKMLSDQVEFRGYGSTTSTWSVIKQFAMKSNKKLEDQHWYKNYDEHSQQLVKVLIEAQTAQGDPKAPLIPVPNPLASPDEGFDPFKTGESEEDRKQKEKAKYEQDLEEIQSLRMQLMADESTEEELTIKDLLLDIEEKQSFIKSLFDNLRAYYIKVNEKIQADPKILKNESSKIFIVTKYDAHQDELRRRMHFLQFFAAQAGFKIQKDQLKVLYGLCQSSPISTDLLDFFSWCKRACEARYDNQVLDLTEVGTFFQEMMESKEFDIKTLPLVGFEFIGQYWVSVNEQKSLVFKTARAQKQNKRTKFKRGMMTDDYAKVDEDRENDPPFSLFADPSNLIKKEMIWDVALQSENPEVVNKAIIYAISMYMSIDNQAQRLVQKRGELTQQLIQKCFDLIEGEPSSFLVDRIITILTFVIQMSESGGTGGVQPHNSILKGEHLDRIIIQNLISAKAENIIVRAFTSATVWEFRKVVSNQIHLSPKYVQFELPNGQKINNSQNGMTLQQLNLKNGDIIIARRINVVEYVRPDPMIDAQEDLRPEAYQLFSDWFDLFKDPEKDKLTLEGAQAFIYEMTTEYPPADDNNLKNLFNEWSKPDDQEHITKEGFIGFFHEACKMRIQSVYENMEAMYIRKDLKKYAEIEEQNAAPQNEMPRYLISENKEHFNRLMDLLNRNDETSPRVWDLIRSLSTNQTLYKQVVSFQGVQDEQGNIKWAEFFEQGSIYKQIYALDIIEELMESGSNVEVNKRVQFVDYQMKRHQTMRLNTMRDVPLASIASIGLGAAQQQPNGEGIENFGSERREWAKTFLSNGGLNYIIEQFLTKRVSSQAISSTNDQFELNKISFMTVLLRVIMSAAFATDQTKNIGEAIALVRKSSSCPDEETLDSLPETSLERKQSSGTDFTLNNLLKQEYGKDILKSTNFGELCAHLITLASQIISRQAFSLHDKIIVENALALWTGCILHEPALFKEFTIWENPDQESVIKNADDFVLSGLLFCPEEKIRLDFQNTFQVLSQHFSTGDNRALIYLLGLLAKNFSLISDRPAMQFFDLFNDLIALDIDQFWEEKPQIYDPENLLSQIIEKVKQMNESRKKANSSQEEREKVNDVKAIEKAEEEERMLVGLIHLVVKILKNVDEAVCEKLIKKQNLIQQIFQEFLFSAYFQAQEEGNDVIKIQQKKGSRKNTQNVVVNKQKSKQAAYTLLTELLQKSNTTLEQFLLEQLAPMITSIKKPTKWGFSPPNLTERYQPYVGLRNLGCICYMNSMLQQFFMVPCFRYNMLCADDGKEQNLVEYKGGKTVDDNMLHQLQRLMAHLELSDRPDYNPSGWCFSFKEYDGTPTKVMEQKDAQEFLNILFDRIDTSLKHTERKYLVNNIFGGKQVSQMVCPECGKVKNKHDDFLTISLPVRDSKSVYDSLQKQVDGETISDYKCDGCTKTVDLSRRTLLSEAPNVLILHLMRIEYNFEKDQLDKINTLFKFPHMLDLKPYSYYEVMEKEGRLPETQKDDKNEEEDQEAEEKMTEEELKKKQEAEEDFRQPEHDDCFEYKLVGVNVHSGTADAGHYWSYINTNRGTDEEENDPTWIQTENDPWMEFNDSHVSDYKFEQLDDDVSGDAEIQIGGGYGGFGGFNWGGKYGKSAYMLFYERRKKKDMKVVVADDKVEEEKAKGAELKYDEKAKEYTKMVPYRQSVDADAKPNEIYKKVFEDNKAFSFESDIYSQEFNDFILMVLRTVAKLGEGSEAIKHTALKIGQKAGFEILARCYHNESIKEVAQVMIEILKTSDELCRSYLQSFVDDSEQLEIILEILLDGKDKGAQKHVARVIKYLVCRMKMIEKDQIESGETHMVTEVIKTQDGEVQRQVEKPVSLAVQFLDILMLHLKLRAPKSWRSFDYFLELFLAYGIHSPEELELSSAADIAACQVPSDPTSEAYQIGMNLFFKRNMIEVLGDFILQDESPIESQMQKKFMGNAYDKPNFSPLLGIVSRMMTDQEMIEKYPLSEDATKIVQSDVLMKMLMEPENDFDGKLALMCTNNLKLTKIMTKKLLKIINGYSQEDIQAASRSLRSFMLIQDEYTNLRTEWIIGVPDVKRTGKFSEVGKYGIANIMNVNETTANYTTHAQNADTPLVSRMIDSQGKLDWASLLLLKELMWLCVQDDRIFMHMYRLPPHSAQYARLCDQFMPYINRWNNEMDLVTHVYHNVNQQQRVQIDALAEIAAVQERFVEKCQQQAKLEFELYQANTSDFVGIDSGWMGYQNSEVIPHWPPQIIVGKQTQQPHLVHVIQTEMVSIKLQEIECEWQYSNPTGLFNLSCIHKPLREKLNDKPLSYKQMKREQANERGEELALDYKDWQQNVKENPVVLHVIYESEKLPTKSRISCKITVADNEKKNCYMPESRIDKDLSPGYFLIAYTVYKIDPSKDHWGDFQIDLDVQPLERAINTNRQRAQFNNNYVRSGGIYDESDEDDSMPGAT